MKKIVSAFLVSVIFISALFFLPSCTSEHPIEKFGNDLKSADSYQINIIMSDVPGFGSMSIVQKVDGNIQYTYDTTIKSETYLEEIGDDTYHYTKDENGKWKKALWDKLSTESETSFIESICSMLDPDNFEKVEGEKNKYAQKSDVNFAYCKDVVITIENNSYTIEMVSCANDSTSERFVFSEFGNIELTLPNIE